MISYQTFSLKHFRNVEAQCRRNVYRKERSQAYTSTNDIKIHSFYHLHDKLLTWETFQAHKPRLLFTKSVNYLSHLLQATYSPPSHYILQRTSRLCVTWSIQIRSPGDTPERLVTGGVWQMKCILIHCSSFNPCNQWKIQDLHVHSLSGVGRVVCMHLYCLEHLFPL